MMKIRIQTYLLVVAMCSTIVGVVLAVFLNKRYRQVDNQVFQVSKSELILKDLEYLEIGIAQVLILSDLVFGSEETYLAEGAWDLVKKCSQLAIQLNSASLFPNSPNLLTELVINLKRIEDLHFKVGQLNGNEEETLNQLDAAAAPIVQTLGILKKKSRTQAENLKKRLIQDREALSSTTRVAGFLYLLTMLVIARWARIKIAKPIEDLTESSRRAIREKIPFKPSKSFVTEVNLLGNEVALIIGNLESTVRERTLELDLKNRYLEEEIEKKIRVESELRIAGQAARDGNRAKSEFLATMSHEIRTPLNAIVGLSGLLHGRNLTSEQEECLNMIRGSIDSLMQIINDVLDFSKIGSGKLVIEQKSFELCKLLESCLDTVTHQASEKGIELIGVIDPQLPRRVHSDPTRLRQIVVNLLSNAVKFTLNGEVKLKVGVESKGSIPNPVTRIHFGVHDTGVGIPKDKQKSIFDQFTQADAGTTRQFGGTGLGLTISSELVGMLGGELKVNSDSGTGAEFYFELPLKTQTSITHQSCYLKLANSLESSHVMIVDRNQAVAEWLTTMFQFWNMRVQTFHDASSALKAVRNGSNIELALIDLNLEQVDGLTLAKLIRKYRSPKELKLILTGYRNDPLLKSAADGIDAGILHRPLKGEVIRQEVRDLMGIQKKADTESLTSEWENQKLGERYPLEILIADDHEINRKVIRKLFHQMGYDPEFAIDGLDALEQLSHKQFDLLFLDIHMPRLDGIETAKRIVSDQKFMNVQPFMIAMTADAILETRKTCREVGIQDFISKPATLERLKESLINYLSERDISSVSDHPVMDLDMNLKCRDLKKSGILDELGDLFEEDLSERCKQIERCLDSGDFEELYTEVHYLHGAALSVGETEVAEKCGIAENEAKNHCADASLKLLNFLKEKREHSVSISNQPEKC